MNTLNQSILRLSPRLDADGRPVVFKVFLALLMGLLLSGCIRIDPDESGVRTINFGRGEGIVQKDFPPGFHRNLWPLDAWHRFPSTVSSIRFARPEPGQPDSGVGALQLTSADGDRVTMSAQVFYKIADGEAHRLLRDSGPGGRYHDIVRGLSQEAARIFLGRLATEQFYDQQTRETIRQELIGSLGERLAQRHLVLVDFLIEGVTFDSNYENLIKQKVIADQRVELERARARAAQQRGNVDRIRAETQVRVSRINQEAEAAITEITTASRLQVATLRNKAARYSAERQADAELYRTRKQAEGQLLIQEAKAESQRLMNEALTGSGGQNVVALETARRIQLPEVVVPSQDADWLNPRAMAKRLGAVPFAEDDAVNKDAAP